MIVSEVEAHVFAGSGVGRDEFVVEAEGLYFVVRIGVVD